MEDLILSDVFGIVILNYRTPNETLQCVQSVQSSFEGYNYKIVIVENGSQDDSFSVLMKNYELDANVKIIVSEQNLGFANGMNLGIKWLQETEKPDFILLLNSDVELIGKNWGTVLHEKYAEYDFAVCGPDIVDLKGNHGNPSKTQLRSFSDIYNIIRNRRWKLFLYKSYLYVFDDYVLQPIRSKIKKFLIANKNNQSSFDSKLQKTNVQLQGSCLIVSKTYFKYYDGLFDKTFLYFEEAILKYFCDTKKLVTLYIPELKLTHKHAVATNKSFTNYRKRRIFAYENRIHSCVVFRDWIEEHKDLEK